jgi:hypothetical protein
VTGLSVVYQFDFSFRKRYDKVAMTESEYWLSLEFRLYAASSKDFRRRAFAVSGATDLFLLDIS